MDSKSKIRMVIQAAKELKENEIVLIGVGLPNLAANFAKKLYTPNLILVYESGSIDCFPNRQPLSIGDPSLSENVSALFSLFEIFSYMINGGRIDVGFLGAAQIDSKGELNTTVIGEYEMPKVRLPGSGGACEILYNVRKSIIMIDLNEEKFKNKVDFVTSTRNSAVESIGRNVIQEEVIITDKCVIRIIGNEKPEITAVYQDTDISELKILVDKLGINLPENVKILDETPPSEVEMLKSMDPDGVYLK